MSFSAAGDVFKSTLKCFEAVSPPLAISFSNCVINVSEYPVDVIQLVFLDLEDDHRLLVEADSAGSLCRNRL